jgi:uncharacterized protein (TIGR01777 family)
MKIFITGGTGFIGKHLSDYFLSHGHQVVSVGTRLDQHRINHKNYRYISADTTQKGDWQEELNDIDAAINLAGRSIFKRWNKRYKKLIYDSRILTTRNLVNALPTNKEVTLCSASAVGYYGNRGDDILAEDEFNGNDFLAAVSKDWEEEAFLAEKKGIKVIAARFGVVLGRNGGAMAKMVPTFRLALGGPIGDGMQWFPWIHIDDLLSAMMFVLEDKDIQGPVNFCAPSPVRNRELAKTLGKALNRPAFIPAPSFMIRIALGEFGTTFLGSQRAIPKKLLSFGFKFNYPDIEKAIRHIVSQWNL